MLRPAAGTGLGPAVRTTETPAGPRVPTAALPGRPLPLPRGAGDVVVLGVDVSHVAAVQAEGQEAEGRQQPQHRHGRYQENRERPGCDSEGGGWGRSRLKSPAARILSREPRSRCKATQLPGRRARVCLSVSACLSVCMHVCFPACEEARKGAAPSWICLQSVLNKAHH